MYTFDQDTLFLELGENLLGGSDAKEDKVGLTGPSVYAGEFIELIE